MSTDAEVRRATLDWASARLQELRGEFAAGESQLAELERHRLGVHQQMLRIEGAIRVLEEQLAALLEADAAGEPS